MNTFASWNISIDCDCPHCDEPVDLTDDSDWFCECGLELCRSVENVEVTCPMCGKDFVVDIEY